MLVGKGQGEERTTTSILMEERLVESGGMVVWENMETEERLDRAAFIAYGVLSPYGRGGKLNLSRRQSCTHVERTAPRARASRRQRSEWKGALQDGMMPAYPSGTRAVRVSHRRRQIRGQHEVENDHHMLLHSSLSQSSSEEQRKQDLLIRIGQLESAARHVAHGDDRVAAREWASQLDRLLRLDAGLSPAFNVVSYARVLSCLVYVNRDGAVENVKQEVNVLLAFEPFRRALMVVGAQAVSSAFRALWEEHNMQLSPQQRASKLQTLARTLSSIMYSLGALKLYPDARFANAWHVAMRECLPYSNIQSLCTVVHGLAKLAKHAHCSQNSAEDFDQPSLALSSILSWDHEFLLTWTQRFVHVAHKATPQQLSMAVWATASLSCGGASADGPWVIGRGQRLGSLRDVLRRSMSVFASFSSEAMKSTAAANTMWGLAKLASYASADFHVELECDEELQRDVLLFRSACSRACLRHFASFSSVELSNTLYALAIFSELELFVVDPFVTRQLQSTSAELFSQALHLRVHPQGVLKSDALVSAQSISLIGWAFAKISPRVEGRDSELFWDMWERMCVARLIQFSSQSLANTIWAVAKLENRIPSEPFMDKLTSSIRASMTEFSAPELSVAWWSLAGLTMKPGVAPVVERFFANENGAVQHEFFGLFLASAADMQPHAMANCLHACARLGLSPPDSFLDAWWESFELRKRQFTPQQLSVVLSAMTDLILAVPEDTSAGQAAKTAEKAAEKARESHFFCVEGNENVHLQYHEDSARLVNQPRVSQGPCTRYLERWLLAFELSCDRFDTLALVNTFWSVARLGWWPGTLIVNRWTYALESKLDSRELTSISDIARVLFACSRLVVVPDDRFLQKMCDAAMEELQNHRGSGREISMLSLALMRLHVRHESGLLLQCILRAHALQKQSSCDGEAVSVLFWCLAKQNLKPSGTLLGVMMDLLHCAVRAMNTFELSNVIWSFAALHIVPDPVLLEAWCQRFEYIAREASASGVQIPEHHVSVSQKSLAALGITSVPLRTFHGRKLPQTADLSV
ncbi:hypothetical protein FVE85_6775 [Porphyridium purpureum]|uniref:Uncharacterized protein n=1 Tax=Porphyridium purpureum TaxID=35688 RepID=A0A5J4Z7V5_PORPP|nr:hypothetical protein FVE85_6775 [Porphyridium purpureum]|eukprot:POR5474..scf295_1